LVRGKSGQRRAQLEAFIKGAKKALHIYDPCISDPAMIRALEERRKAGVEVQILGQLTRKSSTVEIAKLHHMRLHTRMILRDTTEVSSEVKACERWNSIAAGSRADLRR